MRCRCRSVFVGSFSEQVSGSDGSFHSYAACYCAPVTAGSTAVGRCGGTIPNHTTVPVQWVAPMTELKASPIDLDRMRHDAAVSADKAATRAHVEKARWDEGLDPDDV